MAYQPFYDAAEAQALSPTSSGFLEPALQAQPFLVEPGTENPPATLDLLSQPIQVGAAAFWDQVGDGNSSTPPLLEGQLGTEELEEDQDVPEAPKDTESEAEEGVEGAVNSSSKQAPKITLDLLSRRGFYDMPMAKAAKILGRTEGSFQRVCRGLGILRWPYRVRKSLQAIMAKTEQYLDDTCQEDGMSKAEVLKVLQAHMDDIKGISGNGMDKATKQYRQYIFKLNHKLARKAAKQGESTAIDTSPFKAKGMLRAASKIQKHQQGTDRYDGLAEAVPTAREILEAGGVVDISGPTRPKPRYFKDLPVSLAFSSSGQSAEKDVMRTMATSAVQNRLCVAHPEKYRAACQRQVEELAQLCAQMDAGLQNAYQALLAKPIDQHQDGATSALYVQQILQATMGLNQPPVLPGIGSEMQGASNLPSWLLP